MTDALLDHQQVTDVIVRYATAIDSRDWDLFRTCFTPDCRADYGEIGRWDGVEAITRFMRKVHAGPSVHRLSNIVITLDGDRATARTYVDAVVTGPGGLGGANSLGHYEDELVRTADGWRIAVRRHTAVRLTFLGPLRVLPSAVASRLALWANKKVAR